MSRLKRKWAIVLGMCFLAAACVTVNIYFPAAKVEKTAEKIVDEVYQQKEAPAKKTPGGQSCLETLLAWLGPRSAHAGQATTVSNAAIRALKNQIGANHRKLIPYYNSGHIGIAKDGMVVLRNPKGLPMKKLASLRRLLAADRQARMRLYQEVARALNQPSSQVGRIQAIFADQWRARAAKGWWVQDNSGAWHKK